MLIFTTLCFPDGGGLIAYIGFLESVIQEVNILRGVHGWRNTRHMHRHTQRHTHSTHTHTLYWSDKFDYFPFNVFILLFTSCYPKTLLSTVCDSVGSEKETVEEIWKASRIVEVILE